MVVFMIFLMMRMNGRHPSANGEDSGKSANGQEKVGGPRWLAARHGCSGCGAL
jgi:hypothetical protein